MNINVWSNFSKRINSTKQPLSGTQKTVLLKDETDIESPTFILDTLDFSINYVEAFGHYYFAHCRNLDGHRTEIVCDIDLLATYKSDISSYTGFVEYTSSSSDVQITDPRNRPTMNVESLQSTAVSIGMGFSTVGTYILGVASKNASSPMGTTAWYSVSPANMQALCAAIYDGTFWQQVKNEFNNPMDAIIVCKWLPFSNFNTTSGCTGTPENIYLGSLDAGVQGAPIINRTYAKTGLSVALSFPYNQSKGKTYLDKAPFSTGVIYLPFVGEVPLDVDIHCSGRSVTFDVYIDVLTGDVVYLMYQSDALADKRMATYSGNCASSVPISSIKYDAAGVIAGVMAVAGGAVATVGAIVSGGALAPAIGAVAGGAAAAIKSTEVHSMMTGALSSGVSARMGTDIIATIFTSVPAETNLTAFQAEQGMPYFKTATLSSLSGFIKCSNASVSCAADEAEKNQINAYLNGGFYFE